MRLLLLLLCLDSMLMHVLLVQCLLTVMQIELGWCAPGGCLRRCVDKHPLPRLVYEMISAAQSVTVARYHLLPLLVELWPSNMCWQSAAKSC